MLPAHFVNRAVGTSANGFARFVLFPIGRPWASSAAALRGGCPVVPLPSALVAQLVANPRESIAPQAYRVVRPEGVDVDEGAAHPVRARRQRDGLQRCGRDAGRR